MAVKTIFNPLLEEGFQKINDAVIDTHVQEDTISNAGTVTLSNSKSIGVKTVHSIITRITAIQTTSGDAWSYEFRGVIKNPSGTVVIVDSFTSELIGTDVGAAAYTAEIIAGTGEWKINVTSGDATAIKWKAESVISEVSF